MAHHRMEHLKNQRAAEGAASTAPAWRRAILLWVILSCMAIAGLTAQRVSTENGMGVSPDSFGYLGAAHSLREGKGLTIPWDGGRPMTHWPPLYPALLAGVGCVGLDSLNAGAWLNAIVFAVSILALGGLVGYATRKPWCAIVAAFLLLTSADFLSVHTWIWSEPLFVCFCLFFLCLMHRYVDDPRPGVLLASAEAASLAMLTRYAGVALVATGVIAIGMFGPKPLLRKLRQMAVFTAVSCTPLIVWLIRNSIVGGTSTDRTFCWHPVTVAQVLNGFRTIAAWLLPRESPGLLQDALVITLIVIVALTVPILTGRRRREVLDAMGARWKGPCLFAIFAAAYAAFILVSISIYDANTPLDSRILSPLFMAGAGLAVCLAGLLWDVRRSAGIIVAVLIAVIALWNVLPWCGWIAERRMDGCGYTASGWASSPLTSYLRSVPADSPIYTNAPGVVFFQLGGRECHRLPSAMILTQAHPNPKFAAEVNAMWNHMVRRDGVIAFYYRGDMQGLPSGADLREMLPLKMAVQYPEETAYVADDGMKR